MTKRAIDGCCTGAARDLGSKGITVNIVGAGSINADWFLCINRTEILSSQLLAEQIGVSQKWFLRRIISRFANSAGGEETSVDANAAALVSM